MGWASTTQASEIDASSYAQTAMDTRDSYRSGIDLSGGLDAFWFSEYSVVGINAAKVPEMREAIRNAVSNIQSHIDGIEAETNTANAFKSDEIKAAVEKYVLAVKDYAKALTSNLLAFSDKLESVHQAWLTSTQTFASESIDASTTNVSSSATYYTEQL